MGISKVEAVMKRSGALRSLKWNQRGHPEISVRAAMTICSPSLKSIRVRGCEVADGIDIGRCL